jgi:hypothetical protein
MRASKKLQKIVHCKWAVTSEARKHKSVTIFVPWLEWIVWRKKSFYNDTEWVSKGTATWTCSEHFCSDKQSLFGSDWSCDFTVTRWVSEKNRPKWSPTHFLSQLNYIPNFYRWNKQPKPLGYNCNFQKLAKANNWPIGENSPNLVTLFGTQEIIDWLSNIKRTQDR